MNGLYLKGIRGGNYQPGREQYLQKVKFTTFDSYIQVFIKNQEIYTLDRVVTNHYNGYNGGILSEGKYGFICASGMSMPFPQPKVLYLYDIQYYGKITNINQLTESMTRLTSLVPNPNHNGEPIVDFILIHVDNYSGQGGWSDGCNTFQGSSKDDGKNDIRDEFYSHFDFNDTGIYELVRDKNFISPAFYEGK
jgi:hypothetical protein